MATGDPYIECSAAGKVLTETSELAEILSALIVVSSTGKVGFRYTTTTVAGENLTPIVGCSMENLSPVDVLRRVIVEDANGDPAIGLILAT